MLKRVMSESGESSEVREEDKQSHHSDSIMECRRTPRQHTGKCTLWLSKHMVDTFIIFKETLTLKINVLNCNILLVVGTPDAESTHRTRSLSPSPPPVRRSLQGQLEDAMAEALSLDDGRQTNLAASDQSRRRRELHHRPSSRKHSKVLPYCFL